MSLAFQIMAYDPKKDTFEPYGFAVLPVLLNMEVDTDTSTQEYFVSSGVFSLTVYEGTMPDFIIEQLKKPADPAIKDMHHSQKVLQLALQDSQIKELGQTSIIVRLVDTQRKIHYMDGFEEKKPYTKYLLP